jgi:hypothetical protein
LQVLQLTDADKAQLYQHAAPVMHAIAADWESFVEAACSRYEVYMPLSPQDQWLVANAASGDQDAAEVIQKARLDWLLPLCPPPAGQHATALTAAMLDLLVNLADLDNDQISHLQQQSMQSSPSTDAGIEGQTPHGGSAVSQGESVECATGDVEPRALEQLFVGAVQLDEVVALQPVAQETDPATAAAANTAATTAAAAAAADSSAAADEGTTAAAAAAADSSAAAAAAEKAAAEKPELQAAAKEWHQRVTASARGRNQPRVKLGQLRGPDKVPKGIHRELGPYFSLAALVRCFLGELGVSYDHSSNELDFTDAIEMQKAAEGVL